MNELFGVARIRTKSEKLQEDLTKVYNRTAQKQKKFKIVAQ